MGSETSGNPLMQMLFPAAVIMGIMYFVVIQPERRKQEERKVMLNNLKKNDEVVTTSGIHGTVVGVKTTTVIVRVDDNVKLEMDKEAVAVVINAKSNA
mgnify:CR=1 FL=1